MALFEKDKIKGILIDLDNTLYDADKAYQEGLENIGLSHDHPDYIRARLLAKKRVGPHSTSKFNRILYFKAYLDLQKSFSPSRLMKLVQRYEQGAERSILAQERVLNRRKLLSDLARRYSICIVTNEVCRTQVLKLKAIDPRNSSRIHLLTSEEVGCEKPSKKIFNIAHRAILELDSTRCIMVGDDLKADILPALRMGMSAFVTNEFSAKPKPIPRRAFKLNKLEDLREILLGA